MNKFLALIAGAAALCSAAAFADTIDAAVGNTLTITQASGAQIVIHYNADHTYTLTADGHPGSGTWETQGGDICMTDAAGRNCYPLEAGKAVGDTWTQPDGSGTQTLALTAGH